MFNFNFKASNEEKIKFYKQNCNKKILDYLVQEKIIDNEDLKNVDTMDLLSLLDDKIELNENFKNKINRDNIYTILSEIYDIGKRIEDKLGNRDGKANQCLDTIKVYYFKNFNPLKNHDFFWELINLIIVEISDIDCFLKFFQLLYFIIKNNLDPYLFLKKFYCIGDINRGDFLNGIKINNEILPEIKNFINQDIKNKDPLNTILFSRLNKELTIILKETDLLQNEKELLQNPKNKNTELKEISDKIKESMEFQKKIQELQYSTNKTKKKEDIIYLHKIKENLQSHTIKVSNLKEEYDEENKKKNQGIYEENRKEDLKIVLERQKAQKDLEEKQIELLKQKETQRNEQIKQKKELENKLLELTNKQESKKSPIKLNFEEKDRKKPLPKMKIFIIFTIFASLASLGYFFPEKLSKFFSSIFNKNKDSVKKDESSIKQKEDPEIDVL